MLLAEDPSLAAALLLQSYPLHPPGKPETLRAEHLPRLRTPTAFVHGNVDPFGTLDELENARALIPAKTALLTVPGGHDLGWGSKRRDAGLPDRISSTFVDLAARR
jgi:predicted alpha/beta-hydrolase family hydrolase